MCISTLAPKIKVPKSAYLPIPTLEELNKLTLLRKLRESKQKISNATTETPVEICKSTYASGEKKGHPCTAPAKVNGCCMKHHKKEQHEEPEFPEIINFKPGCRAIIKSGKRAGQQCCCQTKRRGIYFCGKHTPKPEKTRSRRIKTPHPDVIQAFLDNTGWTKEDFDNVFRHKLYSEELDDKNNVDIKVTIDNTRDKINKYLTGFKEKFVKKFEQSLNFLKDYRENQIQDWKSTISFFIEHPDKYHVNFEDYLYRTIQIEGNIGYDPTIRQQAKKEYIQKLKYAEKAYNKKLELLPHSTFNHEVPFNHALPRIYTSLSMVFNLRKEMKKSHILFENDIIPPYLFNKYIFNNEKNMKYEKLPNISLDEFLEQKSEEYPLIQRFPEVPNLAYMFQFEDVRDYNPNIPYVIVHLAKVEENDGQLSVMHYHCIQEIERFFPEMELNPRNPHIETISQFVPRSMQCDTDGFLI